MEICCSYVLYGLQVITAETSSVVRSLLETNKPKLYFGLGRPLRFGLGLLLTLYPIARIALTRQHAAQLVNPAALAAADGIFESEYLGEPWLDQDCASILCKQISRIPLENYFIPKITKIF